MIRKLGKRPARPGAVRFKFGAYFDPARLPAPPLVFGHEQLVRQPWGLLGNDSYGDCVLAGAAHETMLWGEEAGTTIAFNDVAVLSDYSAITGFNPNNPSSDNGTDMSDAAAYRRKTGIIDSDGRRHTVDSYVALRPRDVSQLMTAAYLFGAVGIGVEVPKSAEAQFEAGQPWDVVAGDQIEGGHYIPIVGRNSRGNILCVTWGRVHAMTPAFVQKYMDEGIAYVSLEPLVNGRTLEGLDADALRSDLSALS